MIGDQPLIWHISGRGSTTKQQVVQQQASKRGWHVCFAECVSVGSEGGRRLNVLQRGTARELYSSMHRGPVAVLHDADPSPRVRTDPRRPLNDRRTTSLDEFCRYKSFVMSLRLEEAQAWATQFDEWLETIECDDSNDPRILPFHIFTAKHAHDLDRQSERRRFGDAHRKQNILEDKRRRRWAAARPGQQHGREPQLIRQLQLPDGFHWDVTMSRSRSPLLTSATTVWRVTQGGYINVHPTGHVRVGKNCSQIWSEKESDHEDAQDLEQSRSKRALR